MHATPTAADCRELPASAEDWLTGFDRPSTRRAYREDLRTWVAWCHATGVDPMQARRTHVERWVRDLEAAGRKPATIDRRVCGVASWYRWLVEEGQLDKDPTSSVRKPKIPKESPTLGLGRTELADWLRAAQAEGGYPYALACLLALNGLRVGEVCAADVTDLGTSGWHSTLELRETKSGEVDTVPLPPQTMMALTAAVGDRREGPLLLTEAGTRMNRAAASRVVRRLARTAGITKQISPHSLRHSAVTAALNAGVPLRDVQSFARHADPSTTVRYDRARQSLDRHASYTVMQHVAGAA